MIGFKLNKYPMGITCIIIYIIKSSIFTQTIKMSVHNSEQTEWGKEANALDQNSYSEQDRTDKSKLESFVRYVCVRIEVESGLGSGRRQVRVVLALKHTVTNRAKPKPPKLTSPLKYCSMMSYAIL